MQAPLVRWERAHPGLTILYVADGRRVTQEAILQVMRTDGAGFPVLHDTNGTMTRTYQVVAYPTAYVVGRDGTVVWEGIPHFDPAAPERAIQAALR
jgi:AhpC/TSA family protein